MEQDLVIARALGELFSDELLSQEVAFRGGTALHKLHFEPPGRYSEDIDLVQVRPGPIGPVMDGIRARLDPWLGRPQWKQGHGRVSLIYRFDSEIKPVVRLRLKIEINTREHLCVLGPRRVRFAVESRWYSSTADLLTYELEELLGTKLRALYQRKKGRDLYDLWAAHAHSKELDPEKVVSCFLRYLEHQGHRVSRAEFEQNLADKIDDQAFMSDVGPLLAVGVSYDPVAALDCVRDVFLSRLE